MDSTVKRKERCITMYKITNNIKTYHNHTYAFVSKLKKGEVKQYDCFTWFYRMNELDNADKSINVVVFNFEGAKTPSKENMGYLELECYYLNEQARIASNAYKALQVTCDMFKVIGFEHKAVIDEVIHQYAYTESTDDKDEWEEDENE